MVYSPGGETSSTGGRMIITMLKRDTGLSQNYYLETRSSVNGTIVTVYRMHNGRKDCVGQFTNTRQDVSDNRPMVENAAYHQCFGEVIEYFNRPPGPGEGG